jgi:acetyl esterase/lipase
VPEGNAAVQGRASAFGAAFRKDIPMTSVEVRRFAANGGRDAAPVNDGALPSERLDADMRHVLSVLGQMGGKPIEALRTPEARAQPTLDMALRRILRDSHDDQGINMEMRLIPGPAGDIRARIYTPQAETAGPRPLILFFHPGAFVLGDVDHYDATPRTLSQRTGAVVVSSHYRQAPEHRFPAAHEDAFAAWNWVTEHAEALGSDPARTAIVGEGSGGNLAINVTLRVKAQGGRAPIHMGLVTPMATLGFDLPSHLEIEDTGPFRTETFKWAARKLLRKKEDALDPRLELLERADLAGLPPATIILAEADPLRSEGEALADLLRRSGVWVDSTTYEGVTHGFFGLYQIVNKAVFAQSQLARNLNAAFGG